MSISIPVSPGRQVTNTEPRRYARFRSPLGNGGILVTKLAAGFETLSALLTGESATRTLSNLHNLVAVRGLTGSDGNLALETSMSGPHHYLGWLDPTKQHVITKWQNGLPIYCEFQTRHRHLATESRLPEIPSHFITAFRRDKFRWLAGPEMNTDQKKRYNMKLARNLSGYKLFNTDTGARSNDSLFSNPGILELDMSVIDIRVIPDPWKYDLGDFKCRVVPNNEPWGFDPDGIQQNQHAQHRLRVVTYNYGPEYVPKYLYHPTVGNGQFIERHEFIQAITPCNQGCSGYVLLGREIRSWALGPVIQLDIIAIAVPYGYTLIVEPWAIHGDSALVGLYSMAMTGNHLAMQTADTVFIRNVHNGKPVKFNVVNSADDNNKSGYSAIGTADSGPQPELLVTSDSLSNFELDIKLDMLKKKIMDSLSYLEWLYWKPEVLTFDDVLECCKKITDTSCC
jgi:hypothetical protein